MGKSIVDVLLEHLDNNPAEFRWLWRKPGITPAAIVSDFQDVIEEANGDLEGDHLRLGDLVEEIVANLSSDEIFELGSGILHRKEKYYKRYG